jgi:hydroxyacylglutathione hydrolase
LFEGTPEEMWHSLDRLRRLPENTLVYCGHEYTEANYRFAAALEPDNRELSAYGEEVIARRGAGQATVPSAMGRERALNPFLRADDPQLGMAANDPVAVFAEIRSRKDRF